MKLFFPTLLTLLAMFLVNCSPKSIQKLFEKAEIETGIFSNRPQTPTQFIAILKLKNPPLLQDIQKDDKGQLQIDAERLKTIQAEQEQAVKDLQAISSEIHILYRYKMVINGFAVVAPISVTDKLRALGLISYVENDGSFDRPVLAENSSSLSKSSTDFSKANSVKWIGADKLHEKQITGKGVKVGIIDTGIDYTHAMFGGPGTEEIYKSVDPKKPTVLFPNKKVLGGIDLVGTEYNSASGDFSKHIPVMDENPIDEAGHGTHVAGTVAGIGDGENTYSGVAPDAELYAIKVFGATGSTGDAVVIAALEYAADPTGKGTLEGRLDVVNLSLGSPYGNSHVLYSEAVKNLVSGGVIMVASAGNSGHLDYIVGSPSVTDEAISVAASIDNGDHNWKFSAVKFSTPTQGDLFAEAIEGSVSKSIEESGDVFGKLVFVGLADEDFSDELALLVKGNVALIDRGKVNFSDKVSRAYKAGAAGVVVVQNQAGAAFQMGGDGKANIPAIMITQALGDSLKLEMKKGDVNLHFLTSQKMEKPELIDTLTGFSSKGPRSADGFFKPEISAPGANIISAAMGKGKAGIKFSGTSMAAPHMTGVMALLKQAYPKLSPMELKSIVMGRAVTIHNEKNEVYHLSEQGAGRVQVDQAADSIVVASKAALSLGILNIESKKKILQKFSIKNISSETQELNVVFSGRGQITMTGPASIKVAAGESIEVKVAFVLDATTLNDNSHEFEGLIKLMKGSDEVFRIPVLAVANRISQVQAKDLSVRSNSQADSAGSAAELTLKNNGTHSGDVLLFNLLGKDSRKKDATNSAYLSRACDMQSAGYRILEKTIEGKKIQILQVAIKLYEPLTTWNECEVSVLIDSNEDGVADQELAGFPLENVKGLSGATDANKFVSVLLDATKARELRKKFELSAASEPDLKKQVVEDYSTAVVDSQSMTFYNQSTVAVVEANIALLARSATGELSVKIAVIQNESSSSEMDDFLSGSTKNWKKLSVSSGSQSFADLPEKVSLEPGEERTLDLTKGEGSEDLLVLMPNNRGVFSDLLLDEQSQILKPGYLLP